MNRRKQILLGMTAAILATASAKAASETINLPDIATFGDYMDTTLTDTFSGTGFVGIYTTVGGSGPAFAHLFGIENYGSPFSETELQAPISNLAGDTISSAFLEFNIVDGSGVPDPNLNVTSFTTTGTLGFNETPPNDLGSLTTTAQGGANSIDVTTLVQNAVAGNQGFLGLFLSSSGSANLWTYTWTGDGADANSAQAELVINFAPSVPDSSSTFIFVGGMAIALLGLARIKSRTV